MLLSAMFGLGGVVLIAALVVLAGVLMLGALLATASHHEDAVNPVPHSRTALIGSQ